MKIDTRLVRLVIAHKTKPLYLGPDLHGKEVWVKDPQDALLFTDAAARIHCDTKPARQSMHFTKAYRLFRSKH